MIAHWTHWSWPWPWMPVLPLVGLAVMVLLAILVFRRGGWMSRCMECRDRRPKEESDSPMEILKRRYAAGEISREQFEQMRRDIE